MDPSTAGVVWLLAGLVAFPLIVIVYVSHSRIKLRRFLSFIARADNIAVGYNKQLIDLYKSIVFIPNVLGVLGDIVAKYYNSLGIQETTVLQLLFFHLGLLVVSLIGLGLLEMAGTRILLIFLGETFSSWAFISGNLFFLSFLYGLSTSVGLVLSVSTGAAIVLFLLLGMYFVLAKSAGTYLEGGRTWER